jgi:hypothetical protein
VLSLVEAGGLALTTPDERPTATFTSRVGVIDRGDRQRSHLQVVFPRLQLRPLGTVPTWRMYC